MYVVKAPRILGGFPNDITSLNIKLKRVSLNMKYQRESKQKEFFQQIFNNDRK